MPEERATESAESQNEEVQEDLDGMEDAALDNYIDGTPEEEDSEAQDDGEKGGESETVDTTQETDDGEKPDPEKSEISLLREQIEKLTKQVSDKEDFIQDRNRTVGALRKQLREEAAKLREGVSDDMLEDPVNAIERIVQAREKEAELSRLDAEEVFSANKADIHRTHPNFEDRLDEVAEIAKSDGVPPEAIRAFKANPYATAPQLLRSLLSRADAAKERRELRELLEKERAARESVASRIASAAAQTRVTGKTPATTTDDSDRFKNINEAEIGDMSDADLDALLEQEG